MANKLLDWVNTVDLTYSADLREMNELYCARFEAKLEQCLAELRDGAADGDGRAAHRVGALDVQFLGQCPLGIAGLLIALQVFDRLVPT